MTKNFVRNNVVDKKTIVAFGNKDGECLAFIVASFFKCYDDVKLLFNSLTLCIEIKETLKADFYKNSFDSFDELAETTFLAASNEESKNLYGMFTLDFIYSESQLKYFSEKPEEFLQEMKKKYPEVFI